jgi:hypothetical protein
MALHAHPCHDASPVGNYSGCSGRYTYISSVLHLQSNGSVDSSCHPLALHIFGSAPVILHPTKSTTIRLSTVRLHWSSVMHWQLVPQSLFHVGSYSSSFKFSTLDNLIVGIRVCLVLTLIVENHLSSSILFSKLRCSNWSFPITPLLSLLSDGQSVKGVIAVVSCTCA